MDREELLALEDRVEEIRRRRMNSDGGPGSGNWGHRGRPGVRGGSMPGGPGKAARIQNPDGSFTSIAKNRKAAGKKKPEEKPGGGAPAADTRKKARKLRERFDAMDDGRKVQFLVQAGVLSRGDMDGWEGSPEDRNRVLAKIPEAGEKYFRQTEHCMEPRKIRGELQEKVAAMSDEERTAWIRKALEQNEDPTEDQLNWESEVQRVAYAMGLNGTPQVVSRKDFDEYVSSLGPDRRPVMYRGVESIPGMTAAAMQYQMAYSEDVPFIGNGIYGDGVYFATDPYIADSYAGIYREPGEPVNGAEGAVSRAVLRPDARVMKCSEEKYDLWGTRRGLEMEKATGTQDPSIYAMATGCDALEVDQGGGQKYYVVLNKAALVMEDPMEDWKAELMGPG